MNQRETVEVLSVLSDAFNQPLSEGQIRVYQECLSDLDYKATVLACNNLVRASKWFPKVAEIREMVTRVQRGPVRAGMDAWGDVTEAIRKVGSYGHPTFQDPVVGRVVRAMGWRSLCLSDSPEASDRARFCELYDHFAGHVREQDITGLQLPVAAQGLFLPQEIKP